MTQDHNDVIKTLCELFPKTFFENQRLRQPLKKNITADIRALRPVELENLDLEAAVGWYVGHYGYWKTTALAGSRRLDLDGNPAGTVTVAEAERIQRHQGCQGRF